MIGNECKIQNNVSIYDNVTLEDGVFCGPSTVFTNVYNPRALIPEKLNIEIQLLKGSDSWRKLYNYLWCNYWRIRIYWCWCSSQ